jgi:large subunit ribosomal protein L27
MSKKKSGGSTTIHTTRPGKRRGVKLFAGQKVKTGGIIVRQKGTVIKAGDNVGTGRDHTLFALKIGIVDYKKKMGKVIAFVK